MTFSSLLGVGAPRLGLRINLSPSMPVGLYRLTDEPIERGVLGSICLPAELAQWALRRAYLRRGPCPAGVAPLLKRVAAVAGDRIELQPDRILINGEIAPGATVQATDRHGRRLPHPHWGLHQVPQDHVWLLGEGDARSFDSRYFGPVPAETVLSVVRPLLIQSAP